MDWPLPCFSANSCHAFLWLEEYLGEAQCELIEIKDNLKMNEFAIINGDNIFLTFEPSLPSTDVQ